LFKCERLSIRKMGLARPRSNPFRCYRTIPRIPIKRQLKILMERRNRVIGTSGDRDIGKNRKTTKAEIYTFTDLRCERFSRPAKMPSTTWRNFAGSSGEAWKSHCTCGSPIRSRDRIGAAQLPRNVSIKCNLSFSGIECPSMNKSKLLFRQCSTDCVNPRADVTMYPFCSSNISRVASRTESYETESIRLGIVAAAIF
jgi:hypothetical protein